MFILRCVVCSSFRFDVRFPLSSCVVAESRKKNTVNEWRESSNKRCGSRREIFHMFMFVRLVSWPLIWLLFFSRRVHFGSDVGPFVATHSVPPVLHLKDFVILVSRENAYCIHDELLKRIICALCFSVWLCVYVIAVFQSSTPWITVLRSDKQALFEGAGVFFSLSFFGTSFFSYSLVNR